MGTNRMPHMLSVHLKALPMELVCVAKRDERVEAVSQGVRTDFMNRELRVNLLF